MPGLNAIIVLSHHNGSNVDLSAAKADGIVGVIHKATQGTQYSDPLYSGNKAKAAAADLLWGAYHFGVGVDGVEQADFFLITAQPDAGTLLVLDFEANVAGSSMDLTEAHSFVSHIQQQTGRWPGLYGGQYLKELLGSQSDPIPRNCWLWLAQYGPTAVLPPGCSQWTMWQYTDGVAGPPPHQVAGIGHCDRDFFNGTVADLAAFWAPAPSKPRQAPRPRYAFQPVLIRTIAFQVVSLKEFLIWHDFNLDCLILFHGLQSDCYDRFAYST